MQNKNLNIEAEGNINLYAIARSLGRNYGSPDGQGQVVRIKITLD